LQGQGWVRVDPTASVAPGRTSSLDRLRAPEGALASTLRGLSPNMLFQLRAVWDAVNNRWDQWVLNYTQGQQLNLLKNLGFNNPNWTDLAYVLIAVVVLVSLAGAGWTLWERQQQDPWLRLLQRARQRLHQLGVAHALHLPPRALALQAQQRFGDTPFCRSLTHWLLALERQRYSANNPVSLGALQREYQHIAWPKEGTP